jgi:hypothetical protein
VSTFALTIVDGVSIIVAEKGIVQADKNDAGRVVDEICPVLPVDLSSTIPQAFAAVLQEQKNRHLKRSPNSHI